MTNKRIQNNKMSQTIPSADMNFVPDWTQVWTAARSEKELNNFTFHGTGWYLDTDDNILVLPLERSREETWHQRYAEGERFLFCVWNRQIEFIFNSIAKAPTRIDNRDFFSCFLS